MYEICYKMNEHFTYCYMKEDCFTYLSHNFCRYSQKCNYRDNLSLDQCTIHCFCMANTSIHQNLEKIIKQRKNFSLSVTIVCSSLGTLWPRTSNVTSKVSSKNSKSYINVNEIHCICHTEHTFTSVTVEPFMERITLNTLIIWRITSVFAKDIWWAKRG